MYDIYLFDVSHMDDPYVIHDLTQVMGYNKILSDKLVQICNKDGRVLLDVCELDDAVNKRNVLISLGYDVKICKSLVEV